VTPCWQWTGRRDANGYGFTVRGQRAHRVSWEDTFGPIPPGLFVCHHCDNPSCVRPDHLFLGSSADNNRDRHAKGRSRGLFQSGPQHPATQRAGERHWRAKLTASDVRRIRERRADGQQNAEIASAYGVNPATISRIARGIWRKEVE
jgi:hypothetical protein